jgi:lipopolysaccharide transport system permease protein
MPPGNSVGTSMHPTGATSLDDASIPKVVPAESTTGRPNPDPVSVEVAFGAPRLRRHAYVRDLFVTLVGRDLKLRYKRSILGIAWSLLTPLTQLAVFYLVFRVLIPTTSPNYLSFLFTGVLVWNWFSGGLFNATGAIVENRDLIKRPGFPAAILPAVTVASYLIHFLLAIPILLGFLVFGGIPITAAILALPLVVAIQFVLMLSLTYFTATFYVTFRDTQYLLGVLLNLLFFVSPIFYNISDLPPQYQTFCRLNPMVHVIEAYRTILIGGVMPDAGALLTLGLATTALLVLGYFFFRWASDRFVDEL